MTLTFGDYVRTRQALWLDKTYGVPAKNWASEEEIAQLSSFHLTNNWRETDRGTLAIINDLQWPSSTTLLAVHRTLLYRFFNSWTGYNRIHETVQILSKPTVPEINYVLNQAGNFSGAYIRTIPRQTAINCLQNLYQHAQVVAKHLEINKGLDTQEAINNNRKMIREELGRIPSFGNFLADQLMLDFAWHGNPWDLTFTPGFGPGSLRALDRSGLTAKQAFDQSLQALGDVPKPRILIYYGDKNYVPVPVPWTATEVEHALCECEKIWKWQEAQAENTGRKVKMRLYNKVDNPRERDAKPPLLNPIPNNWLKPAF